MRLIVPSVFLLVAVVAMWMATAGRTARSTAANVALVASVVAVLSLTLAPGYAADKDLELVPLGEIVDALTPPFEPLLAEVVLNVVLFVPFGAALALRRVSVGRTVLAAVALSATVELAQLLVVSGRTTSVDDVLLNTAGAWIGHAALWARTTR
jgi:glycopeptide antibiotics resistance protein